MSHDEFVDMLLNAMKSRRDFYRQNQDSVEDKKEAGEPAGEVAKLLTLSGLGRQLGGEGDIFDRVLVDLRKHTQWGVLNSEFDFDNGKLVHHYVQGDYGYGRKCFSFVAHPDKKWLVVLSVFEEDSETAYDYGDISILVCKNISKDRIKDKVRAHVLEELKNIAEGMQADFIDVMGNMAHDFRITTSDVLNVLKGIDLFKPVLAKKQRDELLGDIQAEQGPTNAIPPPKSPPKM